VRRKRHNHRFRVPGLWRVDGDLGGDHDLILGADGLRVMALSEQK
jgi:hypothetical protein